MQITEDTFCELGLADQTEAVVAEAVASASASSHRGSNSMTVRVGQLLVFDLNKLKKNKVDEECLGVLTEDEETDPVNVVDQSLDQCIASARGVAKSLRAFKEDDAIVTLADYFDAVIEATVAGNEAFNKMVMTKFQINLRSRRCSILMQGIMSFNRFVPSFFNSTKRLVHQYEAKYKDQRDKTKRLADRVGKYLSRVQSIDLDNFENGPETHKRLQEKVDDETIQHGANKILQALNNLDEDKTVIDRHLSKINSRLPELSSDVSNELSSKTYSLDDDEKIPDSKVETSEAEKVVAKMKDNLQSMTKSVSEILNSQSASASKIQLISRMEDMRSEHTHSRYSIETILTRAEKVLHNCNLFVRNLANQYVFHLLKLAALWDQLEELNNRANLFRQAFEKVVSFNSQLGTLRGLPSAIKAGLHEQQRRKVFLKSVADDIQAFCQSLFERLGRENSRRRKFIRKHGHLIPDGVLPELNSWAPELDVTLKVGSEEEHLTESIPKEFSSSARSTRHTPSFGPAASEGLSASKLQAQDHSPGLTATDSHRKGSICSTSPYSQPLAASEAKDMPFSLDPTTTKTTTTEGVSKPTHEDESDRKDRQQAEGAESSSLPQEYNENDKAKYIRKLEEENASLRLELESARMINSLSCEENIERQRERALEDETENLSFVTLREIQDCIRSTFDVTQAIQNEHEPECPDNNGMNDGLQERSRLTNTIHRLLRDHYRFANCISKLRDTLMQMSMDAERSIACRNFHIGDTMLFVQLKPPTFYGAFNMDDPHYYLSSRAVKRETPSTKSANRLPAFILVEATSIKSFVASESSNPYRLVSGTLYHIVDGNVLGSSFSVLPPSGGPTSGVYTGRTSQTGLRAFGETEKHERGSFTNAPTRRHSESDTGDDTSQSPKPTMKRAKSLPANFNESGRG